MKAGTILYYSVDRAIDVLQSATLPNDLQKVALVTFTDGLDQGSFMLNNKYSTPAEWRNAINSRMPY